jgi:2-haloacid dehalogenase
VRQVAVFDAYGTLFDTQALAESAEAQFPGRGAELVRVWRAKQLEYTWLRSLMGRYEDFWAVTRASLEFACEALDLPLSGPARDRLLEEFLRVPAFPDAPLALSQLRARGFVAACSPTAPGLWWRRRCPAPDWGRTWTRCSAWTRR